MPIRIATWLGTKSIAQRLLVDTGHRSQHSKETSQPTLQRVFSRERHICSSSPPMTQLGTKAPVRRKSVKEFSRLFCVSGACVVSSEFRIPHVRIMFFERPSVIENVRAKP